MFELMTKLVETRFKAGWDASAASTVPVRWQNMPWKQPASAEWIAFNIIEGDGIQASLGSVLERQFAVVMVQVFTPKNSGKRRGAALADIVAGILRRISFSSEGITIVFETPASAHVGESRDIYQTNVNVPFRGEKIFS